MTAVLNLKSICVFIVGKSNFYRTPMKSDSNSRGLRILQFLIDDIADGVI
jgi:hypothetical protein